MKKIKNFLSMQEVRSIEHANMLLQQFEWEYNRTPHGSLIANHESSSTTLHKVADVVC